VLFGPLLQVVHIQKPDHPPSISHESHPKLDPHTHHNNALNSNNELKKGRDNHTYALGGSKDNISARLLFFGVFVALLVFFCFKLTPLGSISPLFTQNTLRGVTIESGQTYPNIFPLTTSS